MDKFDRIQQLHRILKSHRRPVPLRTIAERLECTERNVRRIIDTMRNLLDAPIEYHRELNGWHYADTPDNRFELPGLWLTSDELQSLILLLSVLENLGNGLLNSELAPMERQIHKLLAARGIDVNAFTEHIRVLPIGNRQLPGKVFHTVSEALLKRRQVRIRYRSYNHDTSERTVSPQNLVYYRENWYLDAWCHLRQDLRIFAIARIQSAEPLKAAARKVPTAVLKEHFAQSYGIFAGKPRHTATLRFKGETAHEVAQQHWHPAQLGQWQGDGYVLEIPYSDSRELIQDILRHAPHVSVESPESLREEVAARLRSALELFEGEGKTTG